MLHLLFHQLIIAPPVSSSCSDLNRLLNHPTPPLTFLLEIARITPPWGWACRGSPAPPVIRNSATLVDPWSRAESCRASAALPVLLRGELHFLCGWGVHFLFYWGQCYFAVLNFVLLFFFIQNVCVITTMCKVNMYARTIHMTSQFHPGSIKNLSLYSDLYVN